MTVLAGKRALVTGGATGIGREFAHALAAAGAEVMICGRRSAELERCAEELQATGAKMRAIRADVTDETDRRLLAEECGVLDILVNNAGYSRQRAWTEVPLAEWREVMAVNVEAPFCLAQLFVPGMVERGWGRVVNVASIYGVLSGNPYFYDFAWDGASYVTSKHALIGLTKHLAVRTAGSGVTVNAISPGMFPDTEANRSRCSAESRARLGAFTPIGRTGQTAELRSALMYLVSPDSSFTTGQNLIVDGGWTSW